MRTKARQTYLWENLYRAIGGGLFTSDPDAMAECFHQLTRGFDDADKSADAWYLRDERAREQAETIKRMIAPTDADLTGNAGGWRNRARRMTVEERSALADAVLGLFVHMTDAEADRP